MKRFSYLLLVLLLTSCASPRLVVSSVSYQSLRNEKGDFSPDTRPKDASIQVQYSLNEKGELSVIVTNLTDRIMTIDKTKSFFVSEGISTAFYDPTIQTSSVTDFSSGSTNTSVNLGAIAGAVGVGGAVGRALNGVNIGGENTTGTSVNNTTYIVDLPEVNIGPKGKLNLGKTFIVDGIGSMFLETIESNLQNKEDFILQSSSAAESPSSFSITLSYSIDDGKSFEKITSTYYTDNILISFVKEPGKVNNVLRNIYVLKPNALEKSWYYIHFNNTNNYFSSRPTSITIPPSGFLNNTMYDYK